MARKTEEELNEQINKTFPGPEEISMISTAQEVMDYMRVLQHTYMHPDHRIAELLKDWATHAWHLMNDKLNVNWRNDWPYSVCHHLATLSKHYEEPTHKPSVDLVLKKERLTGFSSAFSDAFARSEFVIVRGDGCEITGVKLMEEVMRKLKAHMCSGGVSNNTDVNKQATIE